VKKFQELFGAAVSRVDDSDSEEDIAQQNTEEEVPDGIGRRRSGAKVLSVPPPARTVPGEIAEQDDETGAS